MRSNTRTNTSIMQPVQSRNLKYAYVATIFLLTLSGFAQMPIFKRYYIADIPGLGWLAQFYTTHFLHYLGAAIILGLAGYLAADRLFSRSKAGTLTPSGIARGALLAGILLSGVLMVAKNSLFALFSPSFVIFLNLTHLGLVMIFLCYASFCAITKRKWIRRGPESME